ncbi:hypothetical protein [Paenibacillus sp. 481]|uniref:hypothetical protein n=1 Tax=Paenibacillus sp. 481 TaxID=2835869 RepID=UPI001E347AA2|nr:hypothetical protein [Paenibacillus sp. 481]UHA72327.1 hypothetical protein KIK04_16780 [Paenibacillus sp. 481]
MVQHSHAMKALSAKELEYIVDSISNEDLLLKQCAATAAETTNPQIHQVLSHLIAVHQQHANVLVQSLQQHEHLAPTQPQPPSSS